MRNWLRVFGHVEASRMGQGVWQPLHTRAGRSEKWWDSVAASRAGMRVIIALFGPYTPSALTAHVSVFSHDFKRFERLTKLATSSLQPDQGCSITCSTLPCSPTRHTVPRLPRFGRHKSGSRKTSTPQCPPGSFLFPFTHHMRYVERGEASSESQSTMHDQPSTHA
jgi:hypothetical protein